MLVELAGEESRDEDFDADEGALLIRPTRVVDVRRLDRERIEALRRELAAARGKLRPARALRSRI